MDSKIIKEREEKIKLLKEEVKDLYRKIKEEEGNLRKEKNEEIEPLLDPKNERNLWLDPHPFFNKLYEAYIKHESVHWVHTEIVYDKDLPDWEKAGPEEKHAITMMLSFFLLSDVKVNDKENVDLNVVTVPEKKLFTSNKIDRENVHTLTYTQHFLTLITDPETRDKYQNAVRDVPVIRDKALWLDSYTENGTYAERCAATICTEGIFFSSSFCIIYRFKSINKYPALTFSNELIARDEGLHRDVAIMEYVDLIKNKLPEEKLINMIKEATELECRFVREALKMDIVGLSADDMCTYVRLCADNIAVGTIGKPIYEIKECPFKWMPMIRHMVKTNFFDKHVSSYHLASMSSSFSVRDREIVIDEESFKFE